MNRLLALLFRRFGLRMKRPPMAIRNPRRAPFAPTAAFKVEREDDGFDYIRPRSAA